MSLSHIYTMLEGRVALVHSRALLLFLLLPGEAATPGSMRGLARAAGAAPQKWETCLSLDPLTVSPAIAKAGGNYVFFPSNFFLVTDITIIQDLYSCRELLYCISRLLEDHQSVPSERHESLDKLVKMVQNDAAIHCRRLFPS